MPTEVSSDELDKQANKQNDEQSIIRDGDIELGQSGELANDAAEDYAKYSDYENSK